MPNIIYAKDKGVQAPSWEGTEWIQLPEGKKEMDISDYKGKVVYLYFFQKWWPGCRKYGFPALREIDSHFKNSKDVGVVGIQTTFEGFYINDFDALKDIADEYKLTIPLGHNGWSGNPSPLMKRYKTRGTPWVVLIDRKGFVRASHFHFEPDQAIAFMKKLIKEN